MIFDETISRVVEMTKQAKRHVCEENGGSTDLNSILVFDQGGQLIGVESSREGNPVENLPDVLDVAYKGGMRRFDSLSFVTDVYFRTKPVDEMKESDYQRGDLAREFSEDPFTDIVEALCVSVISWSGDSRVIVLQYKYDDHGLPVFVDTTEAVTESGDKIGGMVNMILSRFLQFCKLSPTQIHNN